MLETELKITMVAIDSIRPNPRNARTHSKRQIKLIAKSIEAHGFISPILVNDNHEIIAGHGKHAAARLLGVRLLPAIMIDHLMPDQIRAYMLADNKLATLAGWDEEILAIELSELEMLGIDIELTGFSFVELDKIQISRNDSGEDVAQDELNGPAVSKINDLWNLGLHRLLCGDALDSASYERVTNGRKADLVFTDPPYNVPINGHVSGNGAIQHREFPEASGEMDTAEFRNFLALVIERLIRVTCDGSIHFICMDWRHAHDLLLAGTRYSELKNICVWAKNNGGMGSLYRSAHELVFVFKNGAAKHVNNIELGRHGRNRTNVWNYPNAASFSKVSEEGNLAALHPTVKPVALVADAILDCSKRKDLILDPFSGSGTTLIACEQTRRTFTGIELDPLYVDLAIRRWQKRSGEKAQHAVLGLSFDEVAESRRQK